MLATGGRLARHASWDTATLQRKIQASIGNSDGHGTIYASSIADSLRLS